MSKSHHSTRNIKKKPLLTPKEKKLAKHEKKHLNDIKPLIAPVTTH